MSSSPVSKVEFLDKTTCSVSVVICAYSMSRLEMLLAAVDAATVQANGPGDEVVVVIDHNESMLAHVRAHVPTGVRVVPNTAEQGLSGARNCGISAGNGHLVAFLDDDAILRTGGIDAIRATMSADPTIAAVGGAVHARYEGSKARWFPEEFGWVVGCDYRGLPPDGEQIRNPIGACMAVRRTALESIGGFSSELGRVGTLPVGCEETLMGIKIRQRDRTAKILRVCDFAVDHFVPADRQQFRYFRRRCFYEGRSKRILTQAVGSADGLSNERAYVVGVLSSGIFTAAKDSIRGDRFAPARAAALIFGFLATLLGFLSARTVFGGEHLVDDCDDINADELVSVVVATVGRDSLARTLDALLGQSHHNLQILVVDNKPDTDRVDQVLSAMDDERCVILRQPVKGASAARNLGLHHANGRIVAFTDDDAEPDPLWIEKILDVFVLDASHEVAAVTGRVVGIGIDTAEQRWFEEVGIFDKGDTTTLWAMETPKIASIGLGQRGTSPLFPYTAGELGSGNNMAFRTESIRRLGGFDEALGPGTPTLGGEDLDLFRRVVLAGATLVYAPEATVGHHHRASVAELRDQMYGYGTGMSAVLVKIISGGDRTALGLLKVVPRGVRMLLVPDTARFGDRSTTMPGDLKRVELAGYLAGPYLYASSKLRLRRRRAQADQLSR
ncbi:hypothetical protein A0W34_06505 [Rhodococcus sp. BH4]|uniref:glycosyltransferase family 2 protein n=1 Tax=Rhodococcus sp. BH4 TaxID=1807790 RepID=UPI0009C2B3EB|nr:glycosyltransferase family 2 protein [Rhodococcus sp. BH4]ARE33024.1 hypothetical protein A0W34_06505 [Rhodococcus sp. BH4]